MGRRKTIVAVVAAALLVAPLAVWAGDRFEDVPDESVFHDDISWLADSGVTFGCNPPDNTQFCPDDNVTREQMAAFMRRLSEGQVVDAATAVEADTLDGSDSSAFARTPTVTRLHYNGADSDGSIGSNYEELRSVGTFVKEHGDSAIMLNWIAHGRANGMFCEFQVRVDGNKDTGSSSTGYEETSGGSAVLYTADSPINVRAIFPDLSTGEHIVSIWVRGSATNCALNTGNFGQTVLVEEISRSVGTGSTLSGVGDTSQQGGEG